jgi:multiple sugar transport system substrate-binding protein
MKFKSGGALFVASALVAAGVGLAAPAQAATTEITMVAAEYGGMAAFWKDFSAKVTAKYPDLKLTVDVVSWNDIDQKVATMVATKQYPDIVNKGDYSQYAAEGLLYKGDQMVTPAVYKDILPAFLDNSKYNGTVYALPDLASARAFFYNPSIFKKAGIKTPPVTWDDLIAVSKKIKAKVPGVYPLALPLGPEEAQAEFQIWAGGNGGRYYANGKWVVNSKANLATLGFLKKLVDAKYTQPNPAKCDRTACAQNLFAQGKAAMINGSVFLGSWLRNDAKSKVPFAITSFPAPKGKKPVTLGVQDYFTAFKKEGNTNLDGISKVLSLLYQPDNYLAFLKAAGGFIPATISGGKALANDASLKPFIKLLPSAVFYPGDQPAWPAVKGAIQQSIGLGVVGNRAKSVLDGIQAKANAA